MKTRLTTLLALCALLLVLASPVYAIPNTLSELFMFQFAAGSTIGGNVMPVEPYSTVAVEVTISASATVTFEGATATTFFAIPCLNKTTRTFATTTTTTGLYICDVAGISTFRTRVSIFGSGTITSIGRASTSVGIGQAGAVDFTNNLVMTSGGVVRSTVMAAAVTTNTTSTSVALPVGNKSIYGSVAGTGAITQTQEIWSGLTSGFTPTVAGGGVKLCTLILSGTTFAGDQCGVITAAGLFYKILTSSTTGTGASGDVTAMY